MIPFSFLSFDVEGQHQCSYKNKFKHCCGDTWLSILNIPTGKITSQALRFHSLQETLDLAPLVYCGKNSSLPPMVFTESDLMLTFNTGKTVLGGAGFILDYVIGNNLFLLC